MSTNRRRHANVVPVASIASWVVVAIFACAAGLGYVHCKNQLHANGRKIQEQERELKALITETSVVRSKIASLSSTAELRRRLNSGFIKLVPIPDSSIVRIHSPAPGEGASELRAVSNERTRE
jgi:hypothetical protein